MVDDDAVSVRCVKLCLVGPPFVGKTTALNRLLGVYENIESANEEQKKYQSTLLANCIQAMAMVSPDKAEWVFAKDTNEEVQLITRYLFGCTKLDDLVNKTAEPKNSPRNTLRSHHISKTHSDKQQPKQLPRRQLATPTDSEDVNNCQKEHNHIIPQLEKLIKQGDYSQAIDIRDATLLNISDIGGQPGFLEMLPALSNGPAMYMVFMNMSKDLDKLYDIPFSRDNTVITQYKATHTVKSTVSQLLSSIDGVHHMSDIPIPKQLLSDMELNQSFSAYLKLKPVAALIGTHKDELGINSDGLDNNHQMC